MVSYKWCIKEINSMTADNIHNLPCVTKIVWDQEKKALGIFAVVFKPLAIWHT